MQKIQDFLERDMTVRKCSFFCSGSACAFVLQLNNYYVGPTLFLATCSLVLRNQALSQFREGILLMRTSLKNELLKFLITGTFPELHLGGWYIAWLKIITVPKLHRAVLFFFSHTRETRETRPLVGKRVERL